MSSLLKIYGVPMSQACRSLIWLVLNKKMSFELILTMPGSKQENGTRHPTYLEKFPNATIPALEDPETGFLLSESHAIMCYLCNKFEWFDFYPKDNEKRAKVDDFLHYHHRKVKEASLAYFAPKVRTDLNLPEILIGNAEKSFKDSLNALDTNWLEKNRFITGDQVTLADLAAYVEIGQLRDCYTNLYDFSPLKNIERWIEDMTNVEGHDDAHLVLKELGDISENPPSMENIAKANITGFKRILELTT